MEVDGGSINAEQIEETFMKKRVLFSLRVAEVATGQVVLKEYFWVEKQIE